MSNPAMNELRAALVVFGSLTVLTGIAYPLLATGIGQAVFSKQVNGSVIEARGRAVGSELLGQPFSGPQYFWSRPSATGPYPYNGAASSGSNQGPTNPALKAAVESRIAALRVADPGNQAPIPVDLVTASGSGLDPHISPAAAAYQLARVARVRQLPEADIRKLIAQATQHRSFGVLGEPRVNVLRLNLLLDGKI